MLEDVGRATLQIVHDLKNQLNGLKLYATFLRKRFEQEDRPNDERETLAKLISGLDRAARDMTMLVKYAQPLEIRRQTNVDLRKMLTDVIREVATHNIPQGSISCDVEAPVYGEFDSAALSQALAALTEMAMGSTSESVVVCLRRTNSSAAVAEAVIEWTGPARPNRSVTSLDGINLRKAVATRIIESHGGRIECESGVIRVSLPLTNPNTGQSK